MILDVKIAEEIKKSEIIIVDDGVQKNLGFSKSLTQKMKIQK